MIGEHIACLDCKQNIEVVTPELSVINHENMSMLFGLHPLGFTCGSCGSHFKPAVVGAQSVQWQWVKVEPPMIQLVKPKSRIQLAN